MSEGSEEAYGAADVWKGFNVAVLDIEQLQEDAELVYPNPVEAILHIQLQPNDVLSSVILHNILGKKIRESTSNTRDRSILSDGVYFARILSKIGHLTKKIIK